jgi:hypothetical protein
MLIAALGFTVIGGHRALALVLGTTLNCLPVSNHDRSERSILIRLATAKTSDTKRFSLIDNSLQFWSSLLYYDYRIYAQRLRELGNAFGGSAGGEYRAQGRSTRIYEGLCGRRRFLIFRGVFGIAPLCTPLPPGMLGGIVLAFGLDY